MPGAESYFGSIPSDQNALDVFRDEWSSAPPPDHAELIAGKLPLYDDARIRWAHEELADLGLGGGFAGRDVVELGPLEGGHTYQIDRLGARSVVAIEANARAYLRCLVAKEVYGIPRARFLLGDGVEHLRAVESRYGVGVACGVLYHLTNPVELIELLARRCGAVFVWTVFYDPEFLATHSGPAAMFSGEARLEHAGFAYTAHRYEYGAQLGSTSFSGGGEAHSHWMEKQEILAALRHFGFADLRERDEPNPLGTALSVVARRPDPAGTGA